MIGKRLTIDELSRVILLYKDGKSLRDIEVEIDFKYSSRHLLKILNANGIDTSKSVVSNKTCKNCGKEKVYIGNRWKCIDCSKISRHLYYEENVDRIREYYTKNKEHLILMGSDWQKNNSEKRKVYAAKSYSNRKEKMGIYLKEWRIKNKDYLNGCVKSNRNTLALYSKWEQLLGKYEEISEGENGELLVFCKYCGKKFQPLNRNIETKIESINGRVRGENNFYCSSHCKKSCPTYRVRKYPRGFKSGSSREVQPELRKLVFVRDKWTCQRCESHDNLHCHHIDPVKNNPIESADIDNCITLCKSCHRDAHSIKGCKYSELAAC